jgi:hypothetical protein
MSWTHISKNSKLLYYVQMHGDKEGRSIGSQLPRWFYFQVEQDSARGDGMIS